VRVALQLEDGELFSLTIAPTDTTTKQITGLTGLPMTIWTFGGEWRIALRTANSGNHA
jgi:hypothetical protein